MRPDVVKYVRNGVSALVVLTLVGLVWSYWDRSGSRNETPESVELLQPDVLKSTQRLEYAETEGNRVLFRITADKYVQTIDKKNLLEGIQALNFGADGTRRDSIQSRRAEYDPNAQGVAFQGSVLVKTHEGAEIQTEAIAYTKSSEVAETDTAFTFRRGGFVGRGRGFAYSFGEGTIRVRNDAEFRLQADDPAGNPTRSIVIRSREAVLGRDQRFSFLGDVEIEQGHTRFSAGEIQVRMDEQGHVVQGMTGRGNATLVLAEETRSGRVGGEELELRFDGNPSTLRRVIAVGGAFMHLGDAGAEPLQLTSARIELGFSEAAALQTLRVPGHAELTRSGGKGAFWLEGSDLSAEVVPESSALRRLRFSQPNRVRMRRGESLWEFWASSTDARMGPAPGHGFEEIQGDNGVLSQAAEPLQGLRSGVDGLREWSGATSSALRGQRLWLRFRPDGHQPRELEGRGSCRLDLQVEREGREGKRTVLSEQMLVTFAEGGGSFRRLVAGGPEAEVRMIEDFPDLHRTTRSDTLQADYAEGALATVVQRGSFRFDQGELHATSREALFVASEQRFVLSGEPRLWDGRSDTTAERAEIRGEGREFQAEGKVRNLLRGGSKASLPDPGKGSGPEAQGFFVSAGSMVADRVQATVVWRGSVKASRGFDYIKTDELRYLPGARLLEARGSVETHLAAPGERPGEGNTPVHVFSDRLIFRSNDNSVEFLDKVQLTSGALDLRANRLVVYLGAAQSTAERMTAHGDVRLTRGAWRGRAEQAEYRRSDSVVILTGDLAEIWDVANRRSAGRRLTIHLPDDRIRIEG